MEGRRREVLATTSFFVVGKKLGGTRELEGRKEGKFLDWEEKGSYDFIATTFFAGR